MARTRFKQLLNLLKYNLQLPRSQNQALRWLQQPTHWQILLGQARTLHLSLFRTPKSRTINILGRNGKQVISSTKLAVLRWLLQVMS